MARRKLFELLEQAHAADSGEQSMTVAQWDRLQRDIDKAREVAREIYRRDLFDNQATDGP